MQVNVEDLSRIKKLLHIEIPEEQVTREIDNAYRELKKTAKLKGFRPGKAPRAVLERYYQKDVNADVSSKLIQESFSEAIKEKELNIVMGSHKIDPPEIAYKQPYKYDATVEIHPTIEDIEFKELSLKKTVYKVTDQEIETQLKMLRKSLTRHEPIAEVRPVQDGDFVLIDYEGFKNGESVEEAGKTENFTLKIGEGKIIKAIDDGLIGMNPGENKEIAATFPEDHVNEKLAGAKIMFQVALKEIRKEIIPEINDDFAKNFGKYQTMDELKAEIVKNLEQGYEKRTEQEMNEQIFKALIERTDFDVPEIMTEYELENIIAEAEQSFKYHNVSMEDMGLTPENMREKYRDIAVHQVKRHLILEKIIDQEKIDLEDGELDKGIEDMAASFGQAADSIHSYYKENPDKLSYFKHTLLEKKAIRLIIENSETQEVEAVLQEETDDLQENE